MYKLWLLWKIVISMCVLHSVFLSKPYIQRPIIKLKLILFMK